METKITPGIIILLVGIWILYWLGRRRFNRRGPGGMRGRGGLSFEVERLRVLCKALDQDLWPLGGMQHFSTYGWALVVVVIERVAKVLGWVLIVCGLLWFLYVWEVGERTEKEIGALPSGVGEIFLGDRVSLG